MNKAAFGPAFAADSLEIGEREHVIAILAREATVGKRAVGRWGLTSILVVR